MAKKAQKQNGVPQANGESTAGYFRQVFKENPGWLGERSNEKLLQRWLTDHPGENEVPKTVKANLANLKSVLRSKKRKKVAGKKQEMQPASQEKVVTVPTGSGELENLEYQIDEALIKAKALGRKDLESVISQLRRARNEVVWKLGQ